MTQEHILIERGFVFLWILALGHMLCRIPGESRDSIIYLSELGLLALFLLQHKVRRFSAFALPLVPVIIAILIGTKQSLAFALVLSVFQYTLELALNRHVGFQARFQEPILSWTNGLKILSIASVWIFSGQLAFWEHHKLYGMVFSEKSRFIIFGLIFLLFVSLSFFEKKASLQYGLQGRPWRWFEWGLLSLLIALFVSFTLFIAPGPSFSHHWSYYTGPAELVRMGGWLLHDVPSQYGFFNILLLAFLPGETSFRNLYFIQIFLYLISAILFFIFWVRVFNSKTGRSLGIPTICAILYFCCGWAEDLEGPTQYPSVGPFRFLFAELLLFVVFLLEKNLEKNQENRSDLGKFLKTLLISGNLIWLIGVFWSFESAIYCSLTWFPSYFILLWKMRNRSKFIPSNWILFPVYTFFLTLIGIGFVYKFSLGTWPDWYAYLEFPLTYARGFGSIPVNPRGVLWYMVLFLSAMLSLCNNSTNGALLSCFFLFWSTSSYYTARSHENNILNLLPIYLLCALCAAATLRKKWDRNASVFWSMSLPAIVVPVSLIFANPILKSKIMERYNTIASKEFLSAPLNRFLPVPPIALRLLETSGYKQSDPIVWINSYLLIFQNNDGPHIQKFWLPFAPQPQFSILSSGRQKIYLDRWIKHLPQRYGYVLYSESENDAPNILNLIGKLGFSTESEWRSGGWVLIKFALVIDPKKS